jgi:hypothetical protein
MPFHCVDEEGLMVIRARGVIRVDDVEILEREEERYFATPHKKGKFLCDCSELKVLSPDAADAMVALMKADNPRVARSAFVVTEGTAALQLKRMIRDAGGAKRAVFVSEAQARAWLRA